VYYHANLERESIPRIQYAALCKRCHGQVNDLGRHITCKTNTVAGWQLDSIAARHHRHELRGEIRALFIMCDPEDSGSLHYDATAWSKIDSCPDKANLGYDQVCEVIKTSVRAREEAYLTRRSGSERMLCSINA
jgi:hypothetical protein